MFVCCDCCVSSGRGLCDELITRPEKYYRLWCVTMCGLETLQMRRPWPTGGCCTPPIKVPKSGDKLSSRCKSCLLSRGGT